MAECTPEWELEEKSNAKNVATLYLFCCNVLRIFFVTISGCLALTVDLFHLPNNFSQLSFLIQSFIEHPVLVGSFASKVLKNSLQTWHAYWIQVSWIQYGVRGVPMTFGFRKENSQ